MAYQLTTAKYKNKIIKASDYNPKIHKGQIYCPYCDPPIKVECVTNSYFRKAKRTNHNCGIASAIYINADWKGRKIVESVVEEDGLTVTIDIAGMKQYYSLENEEERKGDYKDKETDKNNQTYNRYKEYRSVFRDVVRSVLQMKSLLEKNPYEKLKGIKFKFKIGNEELNIGEVVKFGYELDACLHGKYRFILFKVHSTNLSKNCVYINAYTIDDKKVSVRLNVMLKENIYTDFKNKIIIAYGKVIYSKNYKQFYVSVDNGSNIRTVNSSKIMSIIESKVCKEYTTQKASQNVSDSPKKLASSKLENDIIGAEETKGNEIVTNKNDSEVAYIEKTSQQQSSSYKTNNIKSFVEDTNQSKRLIERVGKGNKGGFIKRIISKFMRK